MVMEGLDQLKELQQLWLGLNRIQSVNMCGLTSLLKISLQSNHLTSMAAFQLLAMIGEQFHKGDEICGAVVSVRRAQDKIAIWTKTASNEATQVSIGKQWKDVLD